MLKFLVPKFIKDVDKTLLLNYPFWYIVKLHYIFYFTILMWLLSYAIGSLLPIDITSYNPSNVTSAWTFTFSILGIVLFCIWIYHLTIYNNENHFGKYNKWDDVKFLIVFMIGINLIMSFSYPMQQRVKTRIANSVDDKVLAEQYNALNMGNKYITTELEDFQYCGYGIHDSVDYTKLKLDNTAEERVDKQYAYNRDLAKYNSFFKYGPNKYYLPSGSDFVSFFLPTHFFGESMLFRNSLENAKQIEHAYTLHTTDKEKLEAIKKYISVINYYQSSNSAIKIAPRYYLINYNRLPKTCVNNFPMEFININTDTQIYNLSPSNNLDVIYNAKFSLSDLLSDTYLLFAFYFSFFTSLLIITFRNNKWKHYLVSVISVILIAIIIGIVSLLINFIGIKALAQLLTILIWIVAAIISIKYYLRKDKYNVYGVVASNLFYVFCPIAPFFISVYLHDAFDLFTFDCNPRECILLTERYYNLLKYSQIIGILLFVIVIMPLYKSFYIKQKALPTEK